MDPRVIRTQKQLQIAFLELIAEKTYKDITVVDIVQRAGVERKTFYRHYKSKNDLLLVWLEQVNEDIKTLALFPPETAVAEAGQVGLHNSLAFCNYIHQHRALFKSLFNGSASAIVREQLRRTAAGVGMLLLQNSGLLANSGIPIDIVANILAEAQVGAVVWWITTDSQHPPALLAELIIRIAEKGVFGLVNWPGTQFDVTKQPFNPQKYNLK
ncbi:MAG TPA: TetR/AcrR family transcriptional regulator [Anaerolineae bacterium]|nr:TetR/AcrR family transcriptional regulator [Anaerolineae bacterium]